MHVTGVAGACDPVFLDQIQAMLCKRRYPAQVVHSTEEKRPLSAEVLQCSRLIRRHFLVFLLPLSLSVFVILTGGYVSCIHCLVRT